MKQRQAIIATQSGRFVDLLHMRPEDVDINDIAWALSNVCRWGGHVTEHYSVAQHCVFVSELLDERFALHGLLHDATEAYVGDIVGPLKSALPEFQRVEARVWKAIAEHFDIDPVIPREVHEADRIALATEWRQFSHESVRSRWSAGAEPADRWLPRRLPLTAYYEYMGRFRALTSESRAA